MVITEDLIIASVFKREALWNPAHILYRNVGVLRKLWQEVAIELNSDEKNVKAKWKNLRSYFVKELRKIQEQQNNGDGADNSHIKSYWAFFEPLMFLKKAINLEKGTYTDEDQNEDNLLQQIPTTLDKNNIKLEYDLSYEEPASPATSQSSLVSSRKRKQNEEFHDESAKRRMEYSQETNSDMLFFESLMPYLQDMSKIQKLRLRSKIQDLILSELETEQNNSKF